MKDSADIGVFGGSGLYALSDDVREIDIETPYGKPSDKLSLVEIHGKKVAFLPRHGKQHTIPPHLINYRANLYAMKELGVKRIISPYAAGSLQPHIKPGDFVVTDQFIDRTWGRADTYVEAGREFTHTSAAYIYCEELREIAVHAGKRLNIPVHDRGTVVVIQGPRFATVSESRWYSKMGWDVINMTQYPEGYLAKELGICYASIALVTDYDAGLEGREDIKPVSHEEVLRMFNANIDKVRSMIYEMVKDIDISCNCVSCR